MAVSEIVLITARWFISWLGYGGSAGCVIGALAFGRLNMLAVAVLMYASTFVVLSVMP